MPRSPHLAGNSVRYLYALLPHIVLTLLGALSGVVAGFVFDISLLTDGGMGPAAAHAGPVILVIFAAVPAFLGLLFGYGGLTLSLVLMIIWDVLWRRWLRRTTVRVLTLLFGIWPWIEFLRATPKEGGWSMLHFVVVALLSLVYAAGGCFSGLILVRFLPHRSPSQPPGA